VYSSVKERMDVSMKWAAAVTIDKADEGGSEMQQSLLKKAIEITQKIPEAETDGKADGTWTNTWHWVLSCVLAE